MLFRHLCQAIHWESSCQRTIWALTRAGNQSYVYNKNTGPVKPPTQTQSCKNYCTVNSRLAHSLFTRHIVPVLPDIHVCDTSKTRSNHNTAQRKWSSSNTSKVVPIFLRAAEFMNRVAIVCPKGQYTYEDLLHYSSDLADEIRQLSKRLYPNADLDERFPLKGENVAFLCGNNMSWVVTLLAVWMCGGVAVPLCKSHPVSELEYFITDCGAKIVISSKKYESQLSAITSQYGLELKVISKDDYSGDYHERAEGWLDSLAGEDYSDRSALIVYTSGTTGRPKGAVHTFGGLDAQMASMVSAWGWTCDDVILHVLPLHHVHGIVNKLLTPLYCGASIVMMTQFDPKETWLALLDTKATPSVNVFMAVPTVYAKLIDWYNKDKEGDKLLNYNIRDVLQNKIRLMVSGSSALPEPIMRKWEELTGHTLLERYGMTELGMTLTNPLDGDRIPGTVGRPFPGVSLKIAEIMEDNPDYITIATADTNNTHITPGMEGNSGELLVKGDNVFKEYWDRPKATFDSFTHDGWFRTGDTAMVQNNVFKIVGRTSVDVIKSGAYKISALDIERHLLEHPAVKDVAVVGLPDETWGQIIAVAIVPEEGVEADFKEIRIWAREKMPTYQVPRIFKSLKEMPRNTMGKVNKKDLAATVFPEYL